jgi:hypothetical protein
VPQTSFQRWAALAAVASAPVALASIFVGLPAVNYDFGALSHPLTLIERGGAGVANALRWGAILDMFGYYLLIAPLALFLDAWLRVRHGLWARLFAGGLLAYVLVGAAGAAVLAAVTPRLFGLYASASAEQRPAIGALYVTVNDAVSAGLWNLLEEVVVGVGWLGLGVLLRRERPVVGIVTIVLGAACLLDGTGVIFGWEGLATAALGLYVLLAPLWALVLGVALLRRPVPATVG